MKTFWKKLFVMVLPLLVGSVVCAGSYPNGSHPLARNEIHIVNGTKYNLEIIRAQYTEKKELPPMQTFVFGYNLPDGGMDVPLTVIVWRYDQITGQKRPLGMVNKVFRLSECGTFERIQWVIKQNSDGSFSGGSSGGFNFGF